MRRGLVQVAGLACLAVVSALPAHAQLVEAVKAGDAAAVRSLVASGADVSAAEPDGTTPLHWAAYYDDLEVADVLLEAGADATDGNRYLVEPISLAALNGSAKMIERLLAAGADANASQGAGETALMTASRSGVVEAVRALIEHGADVNAREGWKQQTALMWAAAEGHVDVVSLLVEHGADVHARSEGGYSATLFAAREGHIGVVETLLDAGSPLDDAIPLEQREDDAGISSAAAPTGIDIFLIAVQNAHYELAARLLDRGVDPNTAPQGWTALHQLTWVRKAGIAGSNDPAPVGSGNVSSLEFARKLVEHGADVNARVTRRPPAGISRLDFVGGTPFLLACRTADVEYMRLLVELGADPLLPNRNGSTPLMVAAGLGTASPGEDPGTEAEVLEAVKYALELGGDINAVDEQGETVMHGAAYKHGPSVVRFVYEAGADIEVWNRPNERGWTPLDIVGTGIHVGMNILSSPETAEVIREIMREEGVEP